MVRAPTGGGVAEIGERRPGLLEHPGPDCREIGKRHGRASRERQRPDRALRGLRPGSPEIRGGFEHQMRVGAAHAERADAGCRRPRGRGQCGPPRGHREPRAVEADMRVEPDEAWLSRDFAVAENQSRLDHPGNAGGSLEMADIGLDRAEQAGAGGRAPDGLPSRQAPPPRAGRRARCRCRASRRRRWRQGLGAMWRSPRAGARPAPVRSARQAASIRRPGSPPSRGSPPRSGRRR